MGGYKEYRIYHETDGTFSVYVGTLHPSGGFFAKQVLRPTLSSDIVSVRDVYTW
jgi:hypothetical protein